MIFLLANSVFLILSIAYGWLAGDRLDKQAVAWIVAALAGTLAATALAPSAWVMAIVLAVDVTLLAAMLQIALRSPRYWPTWFVGLHLAGVTCGVAAMLAPEAFSQTLRAFAGFWGVPAVLVMVFGLFLDRRTQAQPST